MKHNYALQNADTRPRLQSRTQKICFVLSIYAVSLKLIVKITSIPFSARTGSWVEKHDITFSHFRITFQQAGICISPVLRSRRANAHLLVRFNAWTSQRLLIWNPIPQLTMVLIWKNPACLKFGETSNRAVENLLQRKLWVWAANDAPSHPPNFLVFLFQLFMAQCILVKSDAVHPG